MKERKAPPKDRLYIAYGSNLNLKQMGRRCPTAEIVGTTSLRGWRLMFRGGCRSAVATIERAPKYNVPVLIWRLQTGDEHNLDIYEGWPHLYRKETLRITVNRQRVYAMIYIMNEKGHPYGTPSKGYFDTILEGYKDADFNDSVLWQAVSDSVDEEKKNG